MWIIEGIEDNIVRLEFEGKIWNFPRALFNEPAIGQLLELQTKEGWFQFAVNVAQTVAAKESSQAELDALNSAAPEGDIQV